MVSIVFLVCSILVLNHVPCSASEFVVKTFSPYAKDTLGRTIQSGTYSSVFTLKVIEARSSNHPTVIVSESSKGVKLDAMRGGMIAVFRDDRIIYRTHGRKASSRPASNGPSPQGSPRKEDINTFSTSSSNISSGSCIFDANGQPFERRTPRHSRGSQPSSASGSAQLSPTGSSSGLINMSEKNSPTSIVPYQMVYSTEDSKIRSPNPEGGRIRSKSNAPEAEKVAKPRKSSPRETITINPLTKSTSAPLNASGKKKRHRAPATLIKSDGEGLRRTVTSASAASSKESSPRLLLSASNSRQSSPRDLASQAIQEKAERYINQNSEVQISLEPGDLILTVVPVRTESIREPEILEVYESIPDSVDAVNFDDLLRIGHYAVLVVKKRQGQADAKLTPRITRRRSKSLNVSASQMATTYDDRK